MLSYRSASSLPVRTELAHRLKGAAAMLSLDPLHQCIAAHENRLRSGVDLTDNDCNRLATLLELTCTAISALIESIDIGNQTALPDWPARNNAGANA